MRRRALLTAAVGTAVQMLGGGCRDEGDTGRHQLVVTTKDGCPWSMSMAG